MDGILRRLRAGAGLAAVAVGLGALWFEAGRADDGFGWVPATVSAAIVAATVLVILGLVVPDPQFALTSAMAGLALLSGAAGLGIGALASADSPEGSLTRAWSVHWHTIGEATTIALVGILAVSVLAVRAGLRMRVRAIEARRERDQVRILAAS